VEKASFPFLPTNELDATFNSHYKCPSKSLAGAFRKKDPEVAVSKFLGWADLILFLDDDGQHLFFLFNFSTFFQP